MTPKSVGFGRCQVCNDTFRVYYRSASNTFVVYGHGSADIDHPRPGMCGGSRKEALDVQLDTVVSSELDRLQRHQI